MPADCLPENAVVIVTSVVDVGSNSKTDSHKNCWYTC